MILQRILADKRIEVERRKQNLPARSLDNPGEIRPFKAALDRPSMSLIAEVKKASPSRGIIVEQFDPVRIACAYHEGGASCLSVLTDEKCFEGSDEYLQSVRAEVPLPVLRKDFVIDEYQVFESRHIGADCILLIVAALERSQLRDYLAIACELGMDALVEVHSESEMETAGDIGASFIGINNRDLETFETDLRTTSRLAAVAPREAFLVSESAIWTHEHIEFVRCAGARAVLVGESLERQKDIAQAVRDLLSEGYEPCG